MHEKARPGRGYRRRETETLDRASQETKLLLKRLSPPLGDERPKTRGDCEGGERPCPYVSCRHSLYLEVNHAGNIQFNHPDLEPESMADSCSLDVADRGGATLEEIGKIMGFTRERSRQLEVKALRKIGQKGRAFWDDHREDE